MFTNVGSRVGRKRVAPSIFASTLTTAALLNAPTGFIGNLLDLQVNGSSKFSILNNGVIRFASGYNIWTSGSYINFSTTQSGTADVACLGSQGIFLGKSQAFGFASSSDGYSGTVDTFITRDAANVLALRNGTNAQKVRFYNTYTDLNNGSWFEIDMTTAWTAMLNTNGNGTGTNNITKLQFNINGSNKADYGSTTTGTWTFSAALAATGIFSTSVSIAGSLTNGAYSYGTLPYSDTGMFGSYNLSTTGYAQSVWSNQSNGTAASADIVLSNDLGTATTYYANFGINSSKFTGTGSLQLPSASYVTSTSGDMVIGTTKANYLRFVANNAATDAITISPANIPTINNPILSGATISSTAITLSSLAFLELQKLCASL